MKEYGNIGIQTESRSRKGAEVRLSQPPITESWSLCGGNDPKVGNRNGTTNRTIIKFKRRQGTHSGRKESVAPHLKQISLDTFIHASGDGVSSPESNMNDRSINGESGFNLPGSMSMARWERDVRNLGETHDLPAINNDSWVGESTNRSAPRWLWVADRLTSKIAQASCMPALRARTIRSGRQNNVARKGNMDW